MDEKQFQVIINKMDIIVRLLALDIVKDLEVQKDKIITLSSFGFGPSEIAKLLGTTPNTVNVALSGARKKAKKEEATKTIQAEPRPTEEPENQKSGEENA